MYHKNIALANDTILKCIPDLTMRANMLATEDFDTVVRNIASFFSSKVNLLSQVFGANKNRLTVISEKEYSQFVKDLMLLEKDISTIVEKVKYEEVMSIKIPVMLGMKTNLIDIVSNLNIGMGTINKYLLEDLEKLDVLIAKVISSEDYRKTTRPFKYDHEHEQHIGSLINVVKDIIDPNAVSDTKKLEELIPNISSLSKIQYDLVTIAKNMSIKNIKTIESLVKTISERVTVLHEQMTTNKDMVVSKSVINNLAYELETTAIFVTNAVSIMQIYNQTTVVLKFIVERLK